MWFVATVLRAQRDAEAQVRFVLRKSRFFQRFEAGLNERQLKVIRRMFEAGPEGFAGGMNARKYVALTGTSKATTTRDLQHLASLGALVPAGGGRSTRYELGMGLQIWGLRADLILNACDQLPLKKDRRFDGTSLATCRFPKLISTNTVTFVI